MYRTSSNRPWIVRFLLPGLLGVACLLVKAEAAQESAAGKSEPAQKAPAEAKAVAYTLKHVGPGPVLKALKELLSREGPGKSDQITLSADEKANRIVVWGPAELHEQIAKMIPQLDVPDEKDKPFGAPPAPKPAGPPKGGPENQVARVYPLQYAQGETVGLAIEQVAPEAQIVFDSRNTRLIVLGPPSAHERVAEAVKVVDVPPGREQEDRVLVVYSLRYLDGSMAVRVIEGAVPYAQITSDEASNRLIALASPGEHQRVREFLEALDVPPDRDHAQSQVTRVYQLQHIELGSALGVLDGMLPESADIRMTAHESNNAIVVAGPAEVHMQIETLLEKLDKPVDTLGSRQLKVFEIANAEAATLAEMILDLFGDDAKISVDPRANAIVATGSEGTLAVIEALLLRLDDERSRETPDTPSPTLQVRVVWLVSGLEGEQAAQPADDLKEVLDELAKLGVTGLRQAAQVLVNTAPSGDFQVSCAPRLDEGPTDMKVQGTFELKQGMPVMDIEITGTLMQKVPMRGLGGQPAQTCSVQRGELASLATKIAAPFGQYVALGVTPAADLTSVFVVQVTPK